MTQLACGASVAPMDFEERWLRLMESMDRTQRETTRLMREPTGLVFKVPGDEVARLLRSRSDDERSAATLARQIVSSYEKDLPGGVEPIRRTQRQMPPGVQMPPATVLAAFYKQELEKYATAHEEAADRFDWLSRFVDPNKEHQLSVHEVEILWAPKVAPPPKWTEFFEGPTQFSTPYGRVGLSAPAIGG